MRPQTFDDTRGRAMLLCVLAAAIALVALGGCGGSRKAKPRASTNPPIAPSTPALPPPTPRPNIVFVLTDDLSMNLLRYMPHVRAMEHSGMTFSNYFVSDSLCCPSRASIFTGNLPHNTHVFSNFGADGGFLIFHQRDEERRTFATALQQAGYRTALMGKYLNGYNPDPQQTPDGSPSAVAPTYVPPGWSDWAVAGSGYAEFDYTLNENGQLVHYGGQPSDYLTDVIAQRGLGFIQQAATAHSPFFLELATFAPHTPYVPAPRDETDFPGLKAPRPPNFDVLPTDPPRWLVPHPPLRRSQLRHINHAFRKRAQSVQAVDQMIGRIETKLRADGLANNTYLVFSSDNGLHTGEHRLMPGKLTAFDTDIHVPLVVVGPGVPAGATTGALAENIDLAATFAAVAGKAFPSDGHSLLPLLHGDVPRRWRNAALVEHHGSDLSGADPDYQQPASGSPRTYEAMRTRSFLYVEYDDGERELYNLRSDPFELHNLVGSLSRRRLTLLHAALQAMEVCKGRGSCWRAMHMARIPPV